MSDIAEQSQSRYNLRPRRKNCSTKVRPRRSRQNVPAADCYKRRSAKRVKQREAKRDEVPSCSGGSSLSGTDEQPLVDEEEQDIKCAICLDTQDFAHMYPLLCGHEFHGQCLTAWFERQLYCPVCRTPQTVGEFTEFMRMQSHQEDHFLHQHHRSCRRLIKMIEHMKLLTKQLQQLEMLCRVIFLIDSSDD